MSTEHGISNEQLVCLIKAGEDVAGNMEKLCLQVRGFIRATAWKYRGYAEMDDLEQEGYLALYPAIDGYDPAAGFLFLTYAGDRIRQAMMRYIQRNTAVHISVQEQELIRKYRRLEEEFLSRAGREPSEREACYYLRLTRKQAGRLKAAMEAARPQSLDACYTQEGEATLGEIIPGPEDVEGDVLDDLEYRRLRAVLWEEVESLPGDQRQVIRSLYRKGQTLKQTGEEIGAAVERVRAIKHNALRELGRPRHGRRLRPFLPEAVESGAYRHSGAEEFNRTWTSSTERAALELIRGRGKEDGERSDQQAGPAQGDKGGDGGLPAVYG